jgi:hypothetical protein
MEYVAEMESTDRCVKKRMTNVSNKHSLTTNSLDLHLSMVLVMHHQAI